MEANEQFRARYARAREAQAEAYADEILEIAHDGRNDWMERRAKGGGKDMAPNHELVLRSRLRVDALKWIMSKMVPKKYGDRIEHEVSADMAVKVVIGGSA
jgi:hypothetical protein